MEFDPPHSFKKRLNIGESEPGCPNERAQCVRSSTSKQAPCIKHGDGKFRRNIIEGNDVDRIFVRCLNQRRRRGAGLIGALEAVPNRAGSRRMATSISLSACVDPRAWLPNT
jgi:hypothetical protein